MKAAASALLALVALGACQNSSGNSSVDSANAIFKAPKASTGSGIDPDTQGPTGPADGEIKPPRSELVMTTGFQYKEVKVDPKDARTRIDLVRTLLGEEWIFVSKTANSGGHETWKFMRRDAARVDVDPFGIPEIYKATKEPIKPVK